MTFFLPFSTVARLRFGSASRIHIFALYRWNY
ncbi:BnaUnng01910D [Brassica napus]|uniref:BnaUnng01910D protein n=1 Tax=Brassica napus TaxID=3708 RepID=A0A078JMZ0_BRANA|nr:BnaUnng01910D [Brassica napus]